MDQEVVDLLAKAGADYQLKDTGVRIPLMLRDDGEFLPLGEDVSLLSGGKVIPNVRLKKVSELFSGTRQPPDFHHSPPPEYVLFFSLIETMAADYCASAGRVERDLEFERIYKLLRRRPDGKDFNPLFSYLQGTVRLYMSLKEVSEAELDAVLARLAKSAKTFSEGPTSRNYYGFAFTQFLLRFPPPDN